MTRHDFLRRLLFVPALGLWPLTKRQTYGFVDVETAARHRWLPASVLLDGVEVADRCRALNDREGWVWLFAENRTGAKVVDPATGEPAMERRCGHVRFIPKGMV